MAQSQSGAGLPARQGRPRPTLLHDPCVASGPPGVGVVLPIPPFAKSCLDLVDLPCEPAPAKVERRRRRSITSAATLPCNQIEVHPILRSASNAQAYIERPVVQLWWAHHAGSSRSPTSTPWSSEGQRRRHDPFGPGRRVSLRSVRCRREQWCAGVRTAVLNSPLKVLSGLRRPDQEVLTS